MTASEDCASVLEQFIHDVANLPAEINHMMEEIQAKDKDMQKCQAIIGAKDGNLQKHIKLNGSLISHPKEKEYADVVLKNYDICQELQNQKIALSDKACILLDRQIKRLDVKIRELQNDGQLLDGPPIPSLFNRKAQHPDAQKAWSDLNPVNSTPLQVTSGNAVGIHHANMNAHRMNSGHHHSSSTIAQPIPTRVSQVSASATNHLHVRTSAPATPASALLQSQQQQRQRESSAGALESNKRRRLNSSVSNLPIQSSNLRQGSIGPGTPKASTPTANTGRAGSAGPRSQAAQQATAAALKKGGIIKKVAPHQQISKLKGKPIKRISGSMKKKGLSPAIRGGAHGGGAGGDGDDDSVLSSAEPSDTDASQTTTVGRSRRGNGGGGAGGANRTSKSAVSEEPDDDGDVDMGDEPEEQEDTREYCLCQSVSYGDMVGCENDACPYEWFHLRCVGLKEMPGKDEIWYCPECRTKPGMGMSGGRK